MSTESETSSIVCVPAEVNIRPTLPGGHHSHYITSLPACGTGGGVCAYAVLQLAVFTLQLSSPVNWERNYLLSTTS